MNDENIVAKINRQVINYLHRAREIDDKFFTSGTGQFKREIEIAKMIQKESIDRSYF